ncbi:ABC transporter substrate-binding protein [Saccharopolyspora sp. ASAGF58]|uniref:ABC transporter substrate-binding protein n=1 Tax=Saccharopolyspora sp. ASAGF58 TaxID=2719023 RepID=UPI00143FD9D4|nr:ABC transporter substrate-binding protein [Saccharopolyspora sp. ASAGF58]QIZ37180.1 ABC transporter substrate-binding protein [Saccharopolyspora sp. ASAGF58]
MDLFTSTHRRRTATLVLATVAVAALAGCAGGQPGGVVVASYGGSFQDAQKTAYFDPFAQESGIEVTGTGGASYDKLKAMVDSSQVDWDVATSDGPSYLTAAGGGLLEPIDYGVVKADGVPADLKQKYGIGYLAFGQVLAWSNKAFPGGLTSEQFFDPSVKARRVLGPNPTFTFEFALLADGVKPTDLYPLDVDRAFKVLDRIKDQVVAFKSPSDVQTLIQQGEVDAAFVGNGRIEDAIKAGADWAYRWDDAIAVTEYWVVPKGAPNVKDAMNFINYATSPQPQAAMSEAILYGPTNANAFNYLDKQRAARLPGSPENATLGATLDAAWWAQNLSNVKPRWDQWLLS